MPRRTRLFIDKLSFTLDVEEIHKASVIRAFEVEEFDRVVERISNFSSGLLKQYQRAYKFAITADHDVTFQIEPRVERGRNSEHASVRRRFLRVEWNPSKSRSAGRESNQMLFALFERCLPSYSVERLLQTMNLTRIDLAFDVHGVSIDSLEVCASPLRKMNTRRTFEPDGRISSMEFGKPTSDRYLLVYNKTLERHLRTQPISTAGRPYIARRIPCTRFELRLHDLGGIDNLFTQSNPFEIFTVRSIGTIGLDASDHESAFFHDACLRRGPYAALSCITNRRTRTHYSLAVRESEPPPWWEPSSIWGELQEAVVAALS